MATMYAANVGPTVHTGAGRLLALLVSTTTTNPVTVTLYDNTSAAGTVLLVVNLNPGQSPAFLQFPRDVPLTFGTGLTLSIPAATNACVWAIGF